MAKWQSKAQIEQAANEVAKRKVIDAVKGEVAQLVAIWEASEYPTYGECEGAIGKVIRENGILATLTQNEQYYARAMANEHFMRSGISEVLRKKARQQEKECLEAFKAASVGRPVVEEGVFRSGDKPGDIVIIGSKSKPEEQRVLTCLTSEFIRTPRDMGQDDDGWYNTFAEPTEEEKATEAYQRAAKSVATEIAYERERKALFEQRRQAELDAIRASGEEPDFLDEFFAGTGDN